MELTDAINKNFSLTNNCSFLDDIGEINDGLLDNTYYKLFEKIDNVKLLWELIENDIENDVYEYHTTKAKIAYFKSKGWLDIIKNETILRCPVTDSKLKSINFKCIEKNNNIYWKYEFTTDDGKYIVLKILS
jgi:hypothetical protein